MRLGYSVSQVLLLTCDKCQKNPTEKLLINLELLLNVITYPRLNLLQFAEILIKVICKTKTLKNN